MSYPKTARKVRAEFDKGFHSVNQARAISDQDVIEAISAALKKATRNIPSSIKYVASLIGRNLRTVKNWFNQDCAPSAAAFLELAREFDEVHEVYLHLTNRASEGSSDPEFKRKADLILKILTGDGDENLRH